MFCVVGRYRLLEPVGQGGMGRVWRAADELLDRPVAVKELRLDAAGAEELEVRRERALREARASARIDHPNVVRVYDVAEEDDRLWIVMELVEAPSLARTVVEHGPLDVHETARIGLALAEALCPVHTAGVLHRDIKPGNVLLGPGGRVVLTDFGIAALQDAQGLTQAGVIVGSPEYIPPERISGRPQGSPSDLWSLGATLCTALTGHSPFERAGTLATLAAVMYEEPQLPPEDGPLTPLLRGLLARDPAARPDVGEVVRFLSRVLAGPPAEPVEPIEPTEPTERERGTGTSEESDGPEWLPRLLTVLVLVAATAVGIVMIITAIRPGGETKLPDTSPAPTVAGTSRPPPSPGVSQTPSP
ncbi:serine/threonine-protein kinase [Streptomyces ureilyticus]|uniref:non-specific serine/threonine protein kinase n=1 Tax=Streptomyces ureilyticus TaxID=1775131 RepID=A0ABX0DPS8_9ACTN|nr:serine/threonine-protein kinase [Streptomyces ureilyticus]NGO43887.1 serine/threonine protein kinase [Streptomyces ureilyticus]